NVSQGPSDDVPRGTFAADSSRMVETQHAACLRGCLFRDDCLMGQLLCLARGRPAHYFPHNLLRKLYVALGAPRTNVIQQRRLAIARSFSQAHVTWNRGYTKLVAKEFSKV